MPARWRAAGAGRWSCGAPPAFAHPPQLLAGDAGDVVGDALVGGSAQRFELGGGHAATFRGLRDVVGASTLPFCKGWPLMGISLPGVASILSALSLRPNTVPPFAPKPFFWPPGSRWAKLLVRGVCVSRYCAQVMCAPLPWPLRWSERQTL